MVSFPEHIFAYRIKFDIIVIMFLRSLCAVGYQHYTLHDLTHVYMCAVAMLMTYLLLISQISEEKKKTPQSCYHTNNTKAMKLFVEKKKHNTAKSNKVSCMENYFMRVCVCNFFYILFSMRLCAT